MQKDVMYRVVFQICGYPNGKIKSRKERFFTSLEDAKAYAKDKGFDAPDSTGRAYIQAIVDGCAFTL